ncbi:MAG: hypothetical protein KF901_14975 [Myxococcales bacterium]|nr:hypothetical protein [Myxococcales bacterium]
MTVVLAGGLACAVEDQPTLVEVLPSARRYYTHVIPPLLTACGTVRPGFDADTYDVFSDASCTIAVTYHFRRDAGVTYVEWWNYIINMSEPDPAADLPPHLDALWPAAGESALHTYFRWRVVETSSVGTFRETDIQRWSLVLEDVSRWGSRAYVPSGFCPELDPPEECWNAERNGYDVDVQESLTIRSSRDDVVLWLEEFSVARQGDDFRFSGFLGFPELGGFPSESEPQGWTFSYLPCEPSASSDGQGPGFCAPCRFISGTNELPRCEWENVRALPANPSLIHPSWVERYGVYFEEIHGGL